VGTSVVKRKQKQSEYGLHCVTAQRELDSSVSLKVPASHKTFHFHYKDRAVNAAYGYNRCLLSESHDRNKYTVWAECGVCLYVNTDGTHTATVCFNGFTTRPHFLIRCTNVHGRIFFTEKNVKEVTYKIHELGPYTGLSLQYCPISVAQMELGMSAKD
jgi:hypothetical protein